MREKQWRKARAEKAWIEDALDERVSRKKKDSQMIRGEGAKNRREMGHHP